ncbi:MAG: sigma-54-dependent transcriptional regulator [Steroidobacteraceae bacterium]|jgi:two-component system C4-dicarboxylate transport response regulator DctD|nr:sigma-54-dependent Fis family transcriptional regulator [Gammaproteobacteria bacterium]
MRSDRAERVILFEDDDDVRRAIVQSLELEGFAVSAFPSANPHANAIDRDFDGIVISDIRLPGMDGRQIFRSVRERDRELPVILITGHGELQEAVDLMREGAYDFISKPFAAPRLLASVRNALEQRALVLDNRRLRERPTNTSIPLPMQGESDRIAQLRNIVRDIADTDVPVLVVGETGTGKETIAKMLHQGGRRRSGALVVLDCAALPDQLIDAELFGSETIVAGMSRRSVGRIELADGGTLFLDNVDNLSPAAQARLLRVVEEKKFTPTGTKSSRSASFRVVSASTVDLVKLVEAGRFRSDLFFRLNTVTLQLPPLRERRDDIATLFVQLLGSAAQRLKRPPPTLTRAVKSHLYEYGWPGNIRELGHYADRIVLGIDRVPVSPIEMDLDPLPELVDRFEASLIKDALRSTRGSVKAALGVLKIPRKTFYDKIARHGIDLDAFRDQA